VLPPDDELDFVLDGHGVLEIEGQPVPVTQGQAVFVPAGARHQFTGYEGLSVLVMFARRRRIEASEASQARPVRRSNP